MRIRQHADLSAPATQEERRREKAIEIFAGIVVGVALLALVLLSLDALIP